MHHCQSGLSFSGTINGFWLSLLGCAFVGTFVTNASGSDGNTELVKSVLEHGWKSLTSLSIEVEDQPDLRPDGAWDSDQVVFNFKRTTSSGSTQTMEVERVMPSGMRSTIESFREDGRNRFDIIRFGNTGVINKIETSYQKNTSEKYKGTMNGLYWLMMPFGTPPYKLLEENGKIVSENVEGESKVFIVLPEGIKIELDKMHDWLPKRLRSDNGSFDCSATEFKRVNGHWFPVAGKSSYPMQQPSATSRRHFRVTSIEVNKSIPPSMFSMPKPNPGVEVHDKESNIATIYGGIKLRDRIIEQFNRTGVVDRSLLVPEIPRSRLTTLGAASILLIAIAVLSLSLGVYLKVGRRK